MEILSLNEMLFLNRIQVINLLFRSIHNNLIMNIKKIHWILQQVVMKKWRVNLKQLILKHLLLKKLKFQLKKN